MRNPAGGRGIAELAGFGRPVDSTADARPEQPRAAIEVLELKSVSSPRASSVKAIVALRVGAVTINGCRIIHQPGAEPWLALPTVPWTDRGGRTRYTRAVELADPLRGRVQDAVLAAWREASR